MTWTWRPTDDPTPPQHRWSAVDVAAVGALARARAVEPAQQGRSSRVALGSRPLRSGSGSEWDPGSCLPCSTTPYWRKPLSPITTVVNVRSHLAAGSTRISSNASYLMEPATCCCDQLISYPSPRLPQNQPLLPLVPLAITDEASPLALRSPQTIFRGEQCTTGALLAPAKARRGAAGWWPTSPSSRWGGRPTTPASWPPTTNSTCPATVSLQAGGMAPAPTPWGWRAKHPLPGSRPCSRVATRRRVSC